MLLGAAAVALLLVAWATETDAIGRLLDGVLDRMLAPHLGGAGARPPSSWPSPSRSSSPALLLVLQVGLVVRAQVLVVHAAREAARAAAVGEGPPPLDGLDPARTTVEVAGAGGAPGGRVTATRHVTGCAPMCRWSGPSCPTSTCEETPPCASNDA